MLYIIKIINHVKVKKESIHTNTTSDSRMLLWPSIAVVFIVSKICCSVDVNCSVAAKEGPPPVPLVYLLILVHLVFVFEQRSCQVY